MRWLAALALVAACGGGAGSNNVDASTFDAGPCVADPVPPGTGECPAACSECTGDHVCRIQCDSGACNDSQITCPEGYACEITCAGLDSCDTTSIQCPQDFACSVSCSSYDACGDVHLTCTNGSCTLNCTGTGPSDSCGGSLVDCGSGACITTCEGQSPTVECAGSCGCDPC